MKSVSESDSFPNLPHWPDEKSEYIFRVLTWRHSQNPSGNGAPVLTDFGLTFALFSAKLLLLRA
jgi:hypothetical protein